jgi:hypothetical protein
MCMTPLYYYLCITLNGVRLSPLGTAATTGLLYQPKMIDDGDCGAVGGMKIDRGNRSTWRKPLPVRICPPQIPHYLTRARTRAAAVGSQRLTAWATVRKFCVPGAGVRRIGRSDLCRAVIWWRDSCWKIAWSRRFIAHKMQKRLLLEGLTVPDL